VTMYGSFPAAWKPLLQPVVAGRRVVAKYPLTRHAIAKIALARGLDTIESDPKWFEKAGKKWATRNH